MASVAGCRSRKALEGTFYIHGNQYTVTLTPDALKWEPGNGKREDGVIIPITEILSTSLSVGEANSPDESFVQLVYIEHKQNQVLVKATVCMAGKMDDCTTWSLRIQECIDAVPGRPRNALVVINPVSGDAKGPELYQEKVDPVFKEASVKTHVIITESADHIIKLIDGYDLASIDSIVTVGGDGTYQIVASTLLQRQMKDADRDLNDPDTDIPETCVPIGVIPSGSGNVSAFQLFGTLDVGSIALGIVKGGRQKQSVQGVWSGGELTVLSFLFIGVGAMADYMYDAQNMRDEGLSRYQILVEQYTLKESTRSMDVSVETNHPILPSAQSAASDSTRLDNTGEERSTYQLWTTFYQGRTPMLSAYISDYMGFKESKDVADLDFTRLYALKEWSGSLFNTHVKQIGRFDPTALHMDSIEHIPCTEYKVTIHNPDEQDGRANMLVIDGEVYFTKEPSFHVKLFPGRMNVFASAPRDFISNNSPHVT